MAANVLTFYLLEKGATAKLSPESCGQSHSFINPRFMCGYKNIIDKKGYVEFRTNLKTYIEEKKNEGKADVVAVWFRDLEAGPTFGINERIDFIPASLLKIPLAITFFDMAESDPNVLEKTITYTGTKAEVPNQTFRPYNPLKNGESYTVDELINHAIKYSDNVAAQLLYEYLVPQEENSLSQTYRDLGILEPGTDFNKAIVTAKGYASIFRQLYNVSFLSQNMSEKLLKLLVNADFPDGIRAGVPKSIITAQKFGERYLDNGVKQLHDCGIIYYPGNPYELCIMTRGNDFNDLKEIIGEISKKVYEEVDSRKIDPVR